LTIDNGRDGQDIPDKDTAKPVLKVDFRRPRHGNQLKERRRMRSVSRIHVDHEGQLVVPSEEAECELDLIDYERRLIRQVSGRPAKPEQIADNLAIDVEDVDKALKALEHEDLLDVGPLFRLQPQGLEGYGPSERYDDFE
jgi:hypothetical protein